MIAIVTIVPILAGTCDSERLVASGHKKICRPPAANMGFCDFKDVVAFGNNQLRRPLAAKVKGHHSGLPQKNGHYIKEKCISRGNCQLYFTGWETLMKTLKME